MSSSRSAGLWLRQLANLLAPGFVYLPSFFVYVQYQGYSQWRPEVLVVAVSILIAGLPVGLLLSLRPRTLGAAAVTVLLFAWLTAVSAEGVADVFARWNEFSQSLSGWAGRYGQLAITFLVALIVFAVPFAVLSRLGSNLGLVLATVFSVTLASSLLLPAEPWPLGEVYRRDDAQARDLPPIIHLVFDEQIGIEGLPTEIAGGAELRAELRQFYDDFGFTLYGRAYSEYSRTNHSMVALLNGYQSLDGKLGNGPEADGVNWRPYWDNRWFKELARRGYLVQAYYMNGWDYCGGAAGHAQRCVTYTIGSITNIAKADLSVGAKSKVILTSFLHSLVPFRALKIIAGPDNRPPRFLPDRPYLYAADSLALLDRILADIRAHPRGRAYFAHLMIPHKTHLLDRDCTVRPDPLTWTNDGELDIPTGVLNTPASREARYRGYFLQVRCLHVALRRFLNGLKEFGVFDDATIVLHGDHGSRIALIAPLTTAPQPLSDHDMADMYSVLYAARAPGLRPGYRVDFASSQALFRETFLGGPSIVEPAEVFLDYPATADSSLTDPPFPRRPMAGFGERAALP